MNRVIRFVFVIAFISFFEQESYGQFSKRMSYTISLDTAKTQVLPFDIPFTVKLDHDKNDPIRYVYLVKLSRNGEFVPDKRTSLYKAFRPLNLLSTGETEGKQTLYVDLPSLKPDKRYMLLSVTTKEQKAKIRELVTLFCEDKSKIEDYKYFPEPYYFVKDPTEDEKSKEDSTKGPIELVIQKKDILAEIADADSQCKICEKLKAEPDKYELETKIEKTLVLQFPYQTPFCDTCYKGSRKELSFITGIASLLEIRREQIFNGTYRLDTLTSRMHPVVLTTEQARTAIQRNANLQYSLAIISVLRQSLLSVRSLYSPSSFSSTYTNNLLIIEEYIKLINKNISALQRNIISNNNQSIALEECLNKINLDVGWQFNSVRGGTSSYNFYTRNAYFIKPDYGAIYYGDRLFNNSGFSGAAPFVGFHINFRATDENVPFWTNFDWRKLPTLQIGVPIFAQNLSQDDSRRHLVADKFSIFTGAGINLAHTARIHYGALWFQALQSVQGSERRYKVTSVPYIGFSIDIRLRKLFPGLSDGIFGVKDVPAY